MGTCVMDLFDCDACGYFGTDVAWAAKMLPEDSDTMCCPECGSEDCGETPRPEGSTVFPTSEGWTLRVAPRDRELAAFVLDCVPNYSVDDGGDIVGSDLRGGDLECTMVGHVLPLLAEWLVFPAWERIDGAEVRRVFGRRAWARGL
jgi:hypothetical protein